MSIIHKLLRHPSFACRGGRENVEICACGDVEMCEY